MTLPDGCYARTAPTEPGTTPQLWRVRIAPGEARSTIGAGDAFLAGFVAARYQGRSPEECLKFAVACGAESTDHLGAGIIDPHQVGRRFAEVTCEAVSASAEVG
jgi:1-phosphofructokinase/tagatose 6-phosphate kinase